MFPLPDADKVLEKDASMLELGVRDGPSDVSAVADAEESNDAVTVSVSGGDIDSELMSLGDIDCAALEEKLAHRLNKADDDATASAVPTPVALLIRVAAGVDE